MVVTPVAVPTRQEVVERGQQVGVTARAGLDDGETGGGVWDEDRYEPVPAIGAEPRDPLGEVHHSRPITGLDLEELGVHNLIVSPVGAVGRRRQ